MKLCQDLQAPAHPSATGTSNHHSWTRKDALGKLKLLAQCPGQAIHHERQIQVALDFAIDWLTRVLQ
jgi:hypothetical protein